MTMDHRHHYLDGLRSAMSILIYPVHYFVNLPFSAGTWMGDNMISREELLAQKGELNSQNTFLKAQMQKFISLEIENMRLRKLLDASQQIGDKVLAAELFAIDLDPFSHKVLINKGSRHNVHEGQPLLDADGVYGQTIYVTPISSTAMLITDPSHAIPVQVNRTGLRAIAAGTGSMDKLDLLHIPNNADIRVGDVLVSSGLGGVFPVGYPVAEVTEVTPDPSQPYAVVKAKPKAQLDRSREVLIVWQAEHEHDEAIATDAKGHARKQLPELQQ